jgi:hypothetical protein
MIELTEQQIQALENPEAIPPRFVNPRTKETFVLLRAPLNVAGLDQPGRAHDAQLQREAALPQDAIGKGC